MKTRGRRILLFFHITTSLPGNLYFLVISVHLDCNTEQTITTSQEKKNVRITLVSMLKTKREL